VSREVIEFLKENIYGWVGNLMRDLDAQGVEISPQDVASALEYVAYCIDVDSEPSPEDFDDFLRDLNDGRGSE
jgi:hypothetical protein